ncbi:MAG TPA: glutamine-synthetase adenylyltransferase, partial [Rhodanobacteraceae bacterium]|nr:glutamine-synthetase adenylyltransferase [Rhodanobacteraceae bacterium]
LAEPRDAARVQAEIGAMRQRWRAERDRSDAATFDLKQGVGGLVDIEFLLQGIVLQHAATRPGLLKSGNTPALIEAAERAGVLSEDAARRLADAHAALLARAIACTLDGRSRIVARDADVERHIEAVRDVARSLRLLDL